MATQKKGFLRRLFSSPCDTSSKSKPKAKASNDSKTGQAERKNNQRSSTVSPSMLKSAPRFKAEEKPERPKGDNRSSKDVCRPSGHQEGPRLTCPKDEHRASAQTLGEGLTKPPERRPSGGQHGQGQGPSRPQQRKKTTRLIKETRFRRRKPKGTPKVDVSKPLTWPCTPDILLEYHKLKPLLSHNEEWLIMELNEYECLIESMETVRLIAKHSKFFELEPDELWIEFFEFIEDVPSYDEMINFDVWQEFRDKRYPC